MAIKKIQLRRDTATDWALNNPILAAGEIGIELAQRGGINRIKIGDGNTPWNDLEWSYYTKSEINETFVTKDELNDSITDLVNAAPETLDTIGELATALQENKEIVDLLEESVTKKANSEDLAKVATSGSYNDLTNKPTIPSAITESTLIDWGFTKNAGTITGIKMNSVSKGTSGVVDLGTVITKVYNLSFAAGKPSIGSGLTYSPTSEDKTINIPTNTSHLTNDSNFITSVTDALGYTPYNSANFTKANIKSTLGISDWALASSKPTYTAEEVGALSSTTVIPSKATVTEWGFVTADDVAAELDNNYHPLTTVDTAPTINSSNLVTSGGVAKAVADLAESADGLYQRKGSYLTASSSLSSAKLDKNTISIAGTSVSLGGGITQNQLITNLGLKGLAFKDSIDLSGYQPLITSTNKLAYSLISGTPTLATVATSGSYNDLSNKPTIPSAITESTVSGWGFTKNAGTITGIKMNSVSKGTSGVVDLGTVITKVYNLSFVAGTPSIGSGLTYSPTSEEKTINIPTKTSHLTNDSGFLLESVLNNRLADYLPLSGGVVYNAGTDTPLEIRGNDEGAYIAFKSGAKYFGYIGVRNDNTPYFYMSGKNHALIHSGNIGSYAVTSGTLDGFPRLTGTSPSGASATGTWGIDISGSANYATSAGNADTLGGHSAQSFMHFKDDGNNYVNASFLDSNLSKKAANYYIEFWGGGDANGWYNSSWGEVTANSGFNGTSLSISGSATVGTLTIGGNSAIHSGNFQSNLIAQATTISEYAHGKTQRVISSGTDLNSLDFGWWSSKDNESYTNGPMQNFGLMVCRLNTVYKGQLAFPYSTKHFMWRCQAHDGSKSAWGSWKTIAFTSDIPTSLPASDVYAWAKASTKPSYSWSEITGKPSTFTPSSHTHSEYLTSHQLISSLYFAAGAPGITEIVTYNPTWGSKTINIPTHTSHLIGDSLTFTSTSAHIIGNSSNELILSPGTGSAPVIPIRIAKLSSSSQGGHSIYCDESQAYDLGTSSYPYYYVYSRYSSASSDETMKNILGNIELSTSQIANAPAVEFTWKDSGEKSYGTIAQYWRGILPELVSGEEGNYGLNYSALGVISAIVLARNIETHEQRISRLEKENSELRKELALLKNS